MSEQDRMRIEAGLEGLKLQPGDWLAVLIVKAILDECDRLDAIADEKIAATEDDLGSLSRHKAKGVKIATSNVRRVVLLAEPETDGG